MKILRRLSILAFILVMASLIGISYAQTKRSTGKSKTTTTQKSKTQTLGNYFHFYLDHATQLRLTGEQRQALQTRREQFLSETQGTRDSLQTAMQEIQTMLRDPNVNRDQLDSRIQDTSAMLADLLVRAVNAHIEAQSVLDARQQQLASQYLGNYMQQFIASGEGTTTPGGTGTGATRGTTPGTGSGAGSDTTGAGGATSPR